MRAAGRPFRVGVASLVNGESAPQFVAFEERLRQLMNGTDRELVVDFMVLGGEVARYPAAMEELASRQPDVLVAPGPEVSLKAARASRRRSPTANASSCSGTRRARTASRRPGRH
jgi:hypothetical protein